MAHEFMTFDLSFDPTHSSLFPSPPPLPSSGSLFAPSDATLLSPTEQSNLLGFLEGFDPWDLDIPHDLPFSDPAPPSPPKPVSAPPYSNPHLNTAPDPSTSIRTKAVSKSGASRILPHHDPTRRSNRMNTDAGPLPQTSNVPLPTHNNSSSLLPGTQPLKHKSDSPSPTTAATTPRNKQVLSSPQKRLNHIMSEQKRRNAIRDGYAQLITLLAPDGAPGLDMPARGRPKGSSSRGGKNSSKGKSGVLFRAVEYIKWLEDGRDALKEEVGRLEDAAGISPPHH